MKYPQSPVAETHSDQVVIDSLWQQRCALLHIAKRLLPNMEKICSCEECCNCDAVLLREAINKAERFVEEQ